VLFLQVGFIIFTFPAQDSISPCWKSGELCKTWTPSWLTRSLL